MHSKNAKYRGGIKRKQIIMREAIILTDNKDGLKVTVPIKDIERLREEYNDDKVRCTFVSIKYETKGFGDCDSSFYAKESIEIITGKINEICRGRSFDIGNVMNLPPNIKFHRGNDGNLYDIKFHNLNENSYDSLNKRIESVESSISMITVVFFVVAIGIAIMFLIKGLAR